VFLRDLEGFDRVSGDDDKKVDGDKEKKKPKKRQAKKTVDWNLFPAVLTKAPGDTSGEKRSSVSARAAEKQNAKAASTFENLSRGRDSILRGKDFDVVEQSKAESDPEWDRLKRMVKKGNPCTAAEKLEFHARCMEQFSNLLGINFSPDEVAVPLSKRAKNVPPEDECIRQEESIYLRSFMDDGGIDAEYIAMTVGISETYICNVFQKRYPCLFAPTRGLDCLRLPPDGNYWLPETVRDFTIDALSRKTWKHVNREVFAARYWITTDFLYELLELLGLCLPAEIAVHLDGIHCRVPFSYEIFRGMYRACFQYKHDLEQVGGTCNLQLTPLPEETGALMKSRLGDFRQTPLHWRLLRLLRERVFRWTVMSENHPFVESSRVDKTTFKPLIAWMKEFMSHGLVKKWEALFLTDGILFHDLVGGMPMGIDKETLQSSCFWIRSSAPRQQTMLEYFRKFEQFNFSSTTLARVLREDEDDEAGETDPF